MSAPTSKAPTRRAKRSSAPTRSRTAASSIDGIFCANESSTFATLRVLQDNGWAGKVRFVGFDSSENMVKGLHDRALDGLVVQDPVKMGYLAVKTMVAHIKGQPVEKRIDTGVHVATPDNMEQPEMQGLLHPDLRPNERTPRFEMRGIRKAFRATVAFAGVDLASRKGKSAGSSARTAPARAR